MVDVFVSYARENRELVEPIAARLSELGVEVFIDQSPPTGAKFRQIIRAKLRDAKVVLVCWSPEALESDWVDYEAEVAHELGTYVPVFVVTPCNLSAPFNAIPTIDLSNRDRPLSDGEWLAVVEQISRKLGRARVMAAARAMASGDDQTLYDFAQRFPEEPLAKKIWRDAEARHRDTFNKRLSEARVAASARLNSERASLDSRLMEALPAFEAWLEAERRSMADGPMPDPVVFVDRPAVAGENNLLNEIASLSSALDKAIAKAEERQAEVARLTANLDQLGQELKRTRDANVTTTSDSSPSAQAELRLATENAKRLAEELAAARKDSERLRTENTRLSNDVASQKSKLAVADTRNYDQQRKLDTVKDEMTKQASAYETRIDAYRTEVEKSDQIIASLKEEIRKNKIVIDRTPKLKDDEKERKIVNMTFGRDSTGTFNVDEIKDSEVEEPPVANYEPPQSKRILNKRHCVKYYYRSGYSGDFFNVGLNTALLAYFC